MEKLRPFFLHLPKAAGRSISRTLEQIADNNNLVYGSTSDCDIIVMPRAEDDVPSKKAFTEITDRIITRETLRAGIKPIKEKILRCSFSAGIGLQLNECFQSPYNWFTFMFCRNPWCRLVSAWRHSNRRLSSKWPQVRKDGTPLAFNEYVRTVYDLKQEEGFNFDCELFFNASKTLDLKKIGLERAEFYERWKQRGLIYYDITHACLLQVDFIPNYRDKYWNHIKLDKNIKLDFLGRFENLLSDWKTVLDLVHLPHTELLFKRHGSTGTVPYQQYYDKKTADLAYEIYKEDVEYFGYDF